MLKKIFQSMLLGTSIGAQGAAAHLLEPIGEQKHVDRVSIILKQAQSVIKKTTTDDNDNLITTKYDGYREAKYFYHTVRVIYNHRTQTYLTSFPYYPSPCPGTLTADDARTIFMHLEELFDEHKERRLLQGQQTGRNTP